MSLDTVIKIGGVLRTGSKNPMKHFKFVSPIPKDKEENYPFVITVPIREDMSFDFSNISITPENQLTDLYFLRYKTSDQDTSAPKYIFGDIYYKCERLFDKKGQLKKDSNESGNYVIHKNDAYDNAKKIRESYIKEFVRYEIQNSLSQKEKKAIEETLKSFISGEPLSIESDNISNKELSLFSDQEDNKAKTVLGIVNKYQLLLFWRNFVLNKDKIESLLKYAPVIQDNPLINGIEDAYIRYVLKDEGIRKKLEIDNIDNITPLQKKQLLLYSNHRVFLHFEFEKGKQWYQQLDIFDCIKKDLSNKMTSLQNGGMIVPTSALYRTLCSGNNKNDIQFPNFMFENSYKSFGFKKSAFEDFLYASSIFNNPRMIIHGTKIFIYVLPSKYKGENISADKYEAFFFERKLERNLFAFNFLNDDNDQFTFTSFDFLFSDASGNTTVDLVELSGIEKSQLLTVKQRIQKAEQDIAQKKCEYFGWEQTAMSLIKSFENILGKPNVKNGEVIFDTESPYYQKRMMEILPLIYTENYFNDDTLLGNMVERVEFSIRNCKPKHKDDLKNTGKGKYYELKYDLILIMNIFQTNNNIYMDIINSKSYHIGLLLGSLAQNLSQEISSFEKNYVGNLTRRISTMSDFIRLKNDIEQKLIMHDKAKYTFQTSYDLAQQVKEFHSQYDKDECAFGFLEGYFKPIPKSKKTAENQETNN